MDAGHGSGNTRLGDILLGLLVGGAHLAVLGGRLVRGAGQLGDQLGAGDGVHVQGLGESAHDRGGELTLTHRSTVLDVLHKV